MNIGAMKTYEQVESELKRYVGRVSRKGAVISREYVDWFTDDDDARSAIASSWRNRGEISHDRKPVHR